MLFERHFFALAIAGLLVFSWVSEAAGTADVLFRQPSLDGFGDRLFVQAHPAPGTFNLISWQKNPTTDDGRFVPVDWNVGEKTGLVIATNLSSAQRGMRNERGATAAQMSGTAVGAYLNSADLSGGGQDAGGNPLPGSGGYKMMVTPQFFFPKPQVAGLFQAREDRLKVSMDLQIPVAVSAQKKGSLAYVNPVLVFIDAKRNVKISYTVGMFATWPARNGPKMVEHIGYDEPSHSWMIHCNLMPGIRWATFESDSSIYQVLPWKGWKHFSYAITWENFAAALKIFREKQPDVNCSTDPADYRLHSFHLNAEITYQIAPAELGWSMRHAEIVFEHN